MKGKRFVLALLLFVTVQMAKAQGWVTVGNAGFTPGRANYTSLAIDTGGTPYVVYQDGNNNAEATVVKYNGNAWITVGNADFSLAQTLCTSTAISRSGTPYVTYVNTGGSNDGPPSVMEYNGNNWETVGDSTYITQSIAIFTSMTIDNNGTPYVAYQDVFNANKVTVMKFNDSSWVTVGNQGFSPTEVIMPSIAVDGNGTPYVIYEQIDSAQIYGAATVMKYDGSNWVTVGTAQFSTGYAQFSSIAIDHSGTPYVAYENFFSNLQGGKATVMKYDGSNWVPVGGATISAGVASLTCIAIDSSGTPYLAYRDSINDYKVTVMKYIDSSWVTVGSPGFTAGDSRFLSLAIDPSGTPYVAYQDYGNGLKATVMKYESKAGIKTATPENNFTIYPNPSEGIFHVSLGEKTATVQVFDMTGKLMLVQTMENNNTTIDASSLANDIYMVRVVNNEGVGNGKLVIER